MLPLVGQELSVGHPHAASLCMAVCITGAQLVMVPVALMAGRLAPKWGLDAQKFENFQLQWLVLISISVKVPASGWLLLVGSYDL